MLGWGMGLIGHRTQASLCARSRSRRQLRPSSAPG
jgi:hypothetical protein